MKLLVKKLHKKAQIPQYQTPKSSGFDFHAIQDVRISPGETKLIHTGLAFSIPDGYELQIRPRSGMSFRTKLRIANTPGTIDSDYIGEIKIIAENIANSDPFSDSTILIKQGDRVAQGVLAPIVQAEFETVDEMQSTTRGAGGLGSTGK